MARCGRGTRSYRGRTQFSNSTSLSLHIQAPRKWYLRYLKMVSSVFVDAEERCSWCARLAITVSGLTKKKQSGRGAVTGLRPSALGPHRRHIFQRDLRNQHHSWRCKSREVLSCSTHTHVSQKHLCAAHEKDETQGASNESWKDRCVISAHFGSVLSVASVPHKPTKDRSRVPPSMIVYVWPGVTHMHARPSRVSTHSRAGVTHTQLLHWQLGLLIANFRVSRTRRQEEEQEDFATTGLDGTMRFWNCENRCQTRCRVMGLEGRSIHVSQDGSLVAVGHSAGQFSVWETRRLQCIYLNSNTKADVHCLR